MNRTQSLHTGWVGELEMLARISPVYKPVRLLNEGGMAQLYLAQDVRVSDVNTWVVLKVLRPHLRHDPQARSMFLDEIRLLRHLEHPNIVCFIDACEETEHPYLVLEYVEGCDLQTFLFAHPNGGSEPLPWILAAHVAWQILEGLAYLHNATTAQNRSLHLVYRDLSPSNILLGIHGEVKLTDFGSSLYEQMFRDTTGQEWRGKFAYLAPELLMGHTADQRSDLFSWGVTVWELFTGQPLFVASNPEAVLEQVRTKPIPALQTIRPEIPAELCVLIARTLERDHHARMSNTRELLRQWFDFLQHPRCQQSYLGLPYSLAEKIAQRTDSIR